MERVNKKHLGSSAIEDIKKEYAPGNVKELSLNMYAPKGYWNLSDETKATVCNGAGPRYFGWLVPDTMWGLNITEEANVHDYMFWSGKTHEDFITANRVFSNNLYRAIQRAGGSRFIKWLRIKRANKYYKAVSGAIGRIVFWSGKNA